HRRDPRRHHRPVAGPGGPGRRDRRDPGGHRVASEPSAQPSTAPTKQCATRDSATKHGPRGWRLGRGAPLPDTDQSASPDLNATTRPRVISSEPAETAAGIAGMARPLSGTWSGTEDDPRTVRSAWGAAGSFT